MALSEIKLHAFLDSLFKMNDRNALYHLATRFLFAGIKRGVYSSTSSFSLFKKNHVEIAGNTYKNIDPLIVKFAELPEQIAEYSRTRSSAAYVALEETKDALYIAAITRKQQKFAEDNGSVSLLLSRIIDCVTSGRSGRNWYENIGLLQQLGSVLFHNVAKETPYHYHALAKPAWHAFLKSLEEKNTVLHSICKCFPDPFVFDPVLLILFRVIFRPVASGRPIILYALQIDNNLAHMLSESLRRNDWFWQHLEILNITFDDNNSRDMMLSALSENTSLNSIDIRFDNAGDMAVWNLSIARHLSNKHSTLQKLNLYGELFDSPVETVLIAAISRNQSLLELRLWASVDLAGILHALKGNKTLELLKIAEECLFTNFKRNTSVEPVSIAMQALLQTSECLKELSFAMHEGIDADDDDFAQYINFLRAIKETLHQSRTVTHFDQSSFYRPNIVPPELWEPYRQSVLPVCARNIAAVLDGTTASSSLKIQFYSDARATTTLFEDIFSPFMTMNTLGKNLFLTHLSLRFIYITEALIRNLAGALASNRVLNTLTIGDNKVADEVSFDPLFEALVVNMGLSVCNITWSTPYAYMPPRVLSAPASPLARVIESNAVLEELRIESHMINPTDVPYILAALSGNACLTSFTIKPSDYRQPMPPEIFTAFYNARGFAALVENNRTLVNLNIESLDLNERGAVQESVCDAHNNFLERNRWNQRFTPGLFARLLPVLMNDATGILTSETPVTTAPLPASSSSAQPLLNVSNTLEIFKHRLALAWTAGYRSYHVAGDKAQHGSNRGKGSGFFSFFRHGAYGLQKARIWNGRFQNAHDMDDLRGLLRQFFTDTETRLKRHSFGSYVLDALNQAQASISPVQDVPLIAYADAGSRSYDLSTVLQLFNNIPISQP